MKTLRIGGLFAALLLLVFIISCQKEARQGNIPDGQQRVTIRLSDNPVNFDAVKVDIQQVDTQQVDIPLVLLEDTLQVDTQLEQPEDTQQEVKHTQ